MPPDLAHPSGSDIGVPSADFDDGATPANGRVGWRAAAHPAFSDMTSVEL
jgi:hypothetical protein